MNYLSGLTGMKYNIQMTRKNRLSLKFLEQEKSELEKDLIVFIRSYDILRRRVVDSEDHGPNRVPTLRQWSGTCAVMGSLELSIHSIERSVEEYNTLISKIHSGDIENSDVKEKLQLRVIEGGL